MDEKVIDSEDREQGGIVPLASSPTGKILEVYASKTRAQALSLTGSNPQALFFATDSDCIVFNGKEYGAQPYPGLLSVNGVDMGHVPGRIDFCAVCTSDAGASTKEISLTSKEGMSHANADFPRVLVVKFSKGNTYQGRNVYLDINGGEQKVRMGDARGFPFLPPGSSLFLACNGGIQWDIGGSAVAHYEIGDVMSGTSTPTSMTVVATRTGVAPSAKSAMTCCLVASSSRPVSVAKRMPRNCGSDDSLRSISATECSGGRDGAPSPSSCDGALADVLAAAVADSRL